MAYTTLNYLCHLDITPYTYSKTGKMSDTRQEAAQSLEDALGVSSAYLVAIDNLHRTNHTEISRTSPTSLMLIFRNPYHLPSALRPLLPVLRLPKT